MTTLMTLVYIVREGKVLLGYKKRGFGANRWNGFGGKVLEHESIEMAAKRELLEESGLVWQSGEVGGVLRFTSEDRDNVHEVHIFRAHDVSGDSIETAEMKPAWFSFDTLPLEEMWPSDRLWLRQFLEGQTVSGSVHFKDTNTVLRHDIQFS